MAELDIAKTTTPTKVADYSVSPKSPDSPMDQDVTYYYNTNFTKWFGHYKSIAKIKNALNAYATWVLGNGYEALSLRDKFLLELITGWGEDTFNSILWNMIVMKKVNGDAYAQIIKQDGIIINLIPLNPQYMRHDVNRKGRIKSYTYMTPAGTDKAGAEVTFQPNEILHLVNDRVTDEIHGVSVIEAVQWNVEAQDEAKRAHRKMVKNNGVVRVIEVDIDDTTKLATLKAQWKTAIENGDVLIIPKDTAKAIDWHGNLDTAGVLEWLRYLEDDFYMSIGVPRVILGGETGATEAGAKISYLTYEPVYTREITELQADLKNQLGIEIKFKKPASLMDAGGGISQPNDMQQNQSQTSFQPNDVQAGVGK